MTTESENGPDFGSGTGAVTDGDQPVIDDAVLERLIDQIDAEGLELLGPDGILSELTSRIMNRALAVEMADHLGYEKGDPAGWGSGNNRNGSYPKTVLTDAGGVDIEVPRDRNGNFEPVLVPKHQRRLGGFNDLILGLVSRGMTVRDVRSYVADLYQVEISPEQVSTITDAIIPELREWQTRPLDPIYPIMYVDAVVVKVRTDGTVRNRPVYLALAIDTDGAKHVLGMWLGDGSEGSKFWLAVLTELRNRGVADVLVVCCDGLSGLGDAIETVWPQATVQTCVVHLIRNSMKFVSYTDRKKVSAALKPIYRAVNEAAASDALDTFAEAWGTKYPAVIDLWRRNWTRFVPFLEFDPAIRRIIYTTNAIESLNYQLRKVSKNKGHFPTDDAVLKIFYLAIGNIGNTRGGELGTGTQGWKQALNAFAIAYPGRLDPAL